MTTQNIYSLTDVWNAGGTTFKGIALDVTDTASASGSLLMDLQVGGASKFNVTKSGSLNVLGPTITYGSGGEGYLQVVSTLVSRCIPGNYWNFGGVSVALGADVFNPDIFLARDAADTLAQRRGTNAQAFRIYNTYTDASNYERGIISWSKTANRLVIGTEEAGTGSVRSVQLGAGNGSVSAITSSGGRFDCFVGQFVVYSAAGDERWRINDSGHFLAATDNTYDIGASNATRPRNVHIAGYVSIGDGITAPGAGTGQARIYVDTADGDLKVVFADGTVKTIVVDT